MYNAAAITPQPARTGTADASSSHQPDRRYSHAEQHDTGGQHILALSQAALPDSSSGANLLFSQAAAPQKAGPLAHKKAHTVQTPGFHIKSKKHHPLYTPASVPGKAIQPKKGKPKAGAGFAIRQPAAASAGPAAPKPISTKDALSLLVGAPTQHKSALDTRHHQVQQDRPGSLAELLGLAEPIKPDEGVEDVEVQDEDVYGLQQLQSPDHQDSAKQLLDTMLEGRLSPAQERPVSQAPLRHAPSPRTPAARASDTADEGRDVVVTPAMTLQRQFIASLQETRAVPTSRHTSGRSQAMPGTLSARLNRIMQLEKAQQTQFQASGSLGRQTMDVTITEHRLEGHIVKCRCHKLNEAGQVFVMFNSKLCCDVHLSPGCHVTLHAPWTDVHLEGCSIPVILCQHVSTST